MSKAWDVVLLDHKATLSLGIMAMPAGEELPEWARKVISAGMPRERKAAELIKREFAKRGLTVVRSEPGRKVKDGPETRWFWQVVAEDAGCT